MPPIAPFHLRSAALKFKCHPLADVAALRFLQRSLDFGHPYSAKSATSHARSTWPAASSSPRGFDLPSKLILPVDISSREMKRHQPGNAGVLCERARLRGGEMAPFGGKLGVLVQERRLDEELVGAARELGNSCDIRCMESGVDHVGDSVSARAAQRVLLEHAEGDEEIVADAYPAVVRRPAPDRSLGFVQPGTDWKLEQIEALSPHIDP